MKGVPMKPFSMLRPRAAAPLTALALAVCAGSAAVAEDIDIYAGVDSKTGAPNVLFFLDNTSNWSANSQAWKKATVRARCAPWACAWAATWARARCHTAAHGAVYRSLFAMTVIASRDPATPVNVELVSVTMPEL